MPKSHAVWQVCKTVTNGSQVPETKLISILDYMTYFMNMILVKSDSHGIKSSTASKVEDFLATLGKYYGDLKKDAASE